ncbi:MAG: aldo/keto reductase [Solobacterium sp.]|nr:aldo/keto reductase [Solobacterium sp.]
MTENKTLTKEFLSTLPKFGFGLMRLPRIEGTEEIDVEQVKQMVDLFLASGMKYFDTAFVYQGSEDAAKKALLDRHPRDSFYLATKLNAGMPNLTEETAKQEFYTSLERTGAGYFDFYLLHALGKKNIDKYNDWHIWEFVKELKEKGLVRHYGFSFHDTPEMLDELLTAHPDVEFVQLQINYADWENPSVESRRCYEVCVKHGKPVVVMEPVKGGALANPPAQITDIMKAADPNASPASWAIRYAASLENVMVVLSGMSTLAQVEDNVSFMKDFKPLDEGEKKVMEDVRTALASIPQIPCTSCRYCTPVCPMSIQIPNIFQAMNQQMVYNNTAGAKRSYANAIKDHGKASDCIRCGACEQQCPQHLEIRDLLVKCAEALED